MAVCLKMAGFEVIEARDGVEAIRLARERQPHVIVLDLRMPRMDGWTAAGTLQTDLETKRTPILAVSADVYPEARARAISAGCVAFMEKPIDPMRLVAEVHRALALGPAREDSGTG